jgi:chemotaxis protein methyltransferase CheR
MTITTADFDYVREMLRRESAIALPPGKEYLVQARLQPVAEAAGHPDVAALVAALRAGGPAGLRRCMVEALTTNETSWFRDREPFAALSGAVLPELLGSRPAGRPLRIWSAACSTGQEPYSIAITLREHLPPGVRCELVASDLSRAVLARAEAGRFSQLEMNRGMPAALLVRYFSREGAHWLVNPALRRDLTFTQVNLAGPSPSQPPFDVIFLRNVLIYFDVDAKRAVLGRIRRLLNPGGWLFLGVAETMIGLSDDFERDVSGKTSAYRLRAVDRAPAGALRVG